MATVDGSRVAHLPLFAGLSGEELAEVLREARSSRYPKNSEVFKQGADATSFFLLLHGHVRASKTSRPGNRSWCAMWGPVKFWRCACDRAATLSRHRHGRRRARRSRRTSTCDTLSIRSRTSTDTPGMFHNSARMHRSRGVRRRASIFGLGTIYDRADELGSE